MPDLQTTRISLATGVTLKVQHGGAGPALIFLHGFPESHRTWRHQMAALVREYRVVAPDQRGFGGSDKPRKIEAYKTDRVVEDLIALADALEIGRFTLVGHDWGGAAAWLAALRHPDRIERLVIVNAPHPLLFQRSLIDDADQRAASQYIRLFRTRHVEKLVKLTGYEKLFEKTFAPHVDLGLIPDAEREAYLADWSQKAALRAMLNWYRASAIKVPLPGVRARKPLWTHLPFPAVKPPTLVVWGLRDKAVLPLQLEGLHDLVDDLRIVIEPDAGHFIPWEKPGVVTAAIRDFMAESGAE